MYKEEITRFEQDGFEVVAYWTPDEVSNSQSFEENWPAPDPLEAYGLPFELYYERKAEYENDEWMWVGVIVEASVNNVTLGEGSLWGIASMDTDYIKDEVVPDLADEAVTDARNHLRKILDSVQANKNL